MPETFQERYQIEEKLGQGGMGAVYLALDQSLNRRVALKVITSDDKESLERFQREAQAIAKLKHPNIIQVYDVGLIKKQHYFTMEYIEGTTLEKVAESKKKPDIRNVVNIIRQIASALDYAHSQNLIHRDIKPANILIDKNGSAYLTDFGIAKQLTGLDRKLTVTGTTVGTPEYMSPEQTQGNDKEIDRRSDIFSLGATLYHCITGRLPFEAKQIYEMLSNIIHNDPPYPTAISRGVSKDLETICLKCLEKDRTKRYQTAGELADDLERYLSGEPILAKRTMYVTKLWYKAKKNKTTYGSIAAALLLLIIFSAYFTARSVRQEKLARQYLKTADEYFRKPDYEQAKEYYIKYLEINKDDQAALSRKDECDKKTAELKAIERNKLVKTQAEAEAKKREIEALSEAQAAYAKAIAATKAFYKKDANMGKVWQQIDEAITILDNSIAKYPTAFGYSYRAMIYRMKDNRKKPEKDLTEAIRIKPDFISGYVLRAVVYLEEYIRIKIDLSLSKNDMDLLSAEYEGKVTKDLETVSRISKENPDAFLSIPEDLQMYQAIFEGMRLFFRGDDKGIRILEEGYDKYGNEEFLYWLGKVHYLDEKDISKAEGYLNKALAIRPQYAEAYFTLGNIKRHKRNWEGALAEYTNALRINPDYADVYCNRGCTRQDKGDLDGAMEDYNKALRINPAFTMALNNRGNVKGKQGDIDGAIEDYTKVLEINPNQTEAYINRGHLRLAYKKDLNGAMEDFNNAIQINPKSAIAYTNRSFIKYEQGDVEGALADVTKAIEVDPKNATAYRNRGAIKYKQGNLDSALEDLSKAIRIDPDYMDAYYIRACLNEDTSNLDGALQDLDNAIRIDPRSAETYYKRGTIKYKQSNFEGAIKDWEKVIELDPQSKTNLEARIKDARDKLKDKQK
ncbi:MAG: tetratricopeptide repeat protein [Planctomycetota bacterium]